jgi:hypothetical protein
MIFMPDTDSYKPHNYREIKFTNVNEGSVAGLAHPIRYNVVYTEDKAIYLHDEVIRFLKEQGFNTLISLDDEKYATLSQKKSEPDIDILKKTAAEHGLNHIFIKYPDFTAPSSMMFDNVIATVTNPEYGRVAIHCGAGAGRTGTILAGIAIHEIISSTPNISPDDTARNVELAYDMDQKIMVSKIVAQAINKIRECDGVLEEENASSVETKEQIEALEKLRRDLQLAQQGVQRLEDGVMYLDDVSTEYVPSPYNEDWESTSSLPPILAFLTHGISDSVDNKLESPLVVDSSSSDTQQSFQTAEKSASHTLKPICSAYSPTSVSAQDSPKASSEELAQVLQTEQIKNSPSR